MSSNPEHPALVNDHALQPNTFRKTAQEKAQLAPAISYGRCVAAVPCIIRVRNGAFTRLTSLNGAAGGSIEGTGFADWPITYTELEPYYVKAEYEFGVRAWVE